MEKPDSVARVRQWARDNGIDPANATPQQKFVMVGQLLKEYGNTALGAVSRDVDTMGKAMRGQATPAQTTAAMMRSYVGPTAGAGLAMKASPNVVRSGAAKASKLKSPWQGSDDYLYHGTGAEFDKFKPRRAGAVWFGDDPGYAGKYKSALPDAKNRVIKAKAALENPLVVDMQGGENIPKNMGGLYRYANTIEDVVGVAKQQGHDGVIFKNRKPTVEGFSSNEIAVFNPEAIDILESIQ